MVYVIGQYDYSGTLFLNTCLMNTFPFIVVPLSNKLMQGEPREYCHKLYIIIVFLGHVFVRQCGSSFSKFDSVGSKTYLFYQKTHRMVITGNNAI